MKTKLFLILIIFSLLIYSCGKKAWPEPKEQEDKVTIKINKVEKKENCYIINFTVKGNPHNIRSLFVEGEKKSSEVCLSCPFKADTQKTLDFLKRENYFNATYCSDIPLSRLRLGIINVYKALDKTYSNVYTISY